MVSGVLQKDKNPHTRSVSYRSRYRSMVSLEISAPLIKSPNLFLNPFGSSESLTVRTVYPNGSYPRPLNLLGAGQDS